MSNHLEAIQQIMQALGPSTAEIDAIIQSEETSWAVQLADENVIVIEWADQPPRLVMSATLGRPEEDARLAVYQTLLSYNFLWKDTGGVKAALAGPTGEVVLLVDFHSNPLYEHEVRNLLLDFAQLTTVWMGYVRGGAGAEGVAAPTENIVLRA